MPPGVGHKDSFWSRTFHALASDENPSEPHMLSFGAPLGLLTLLALPAVLAAYFLRRRQPVRVVSALFLWRTPQHRADAGPRLERLSRERSLILELLAVLAATAFLSDLGCAQTATQTQLVVVLDGSLSMQASVDGHSSRDRALELLTQLISESRPAVVTVIESGTRPTVLAGPRLEAARVLAQLDGWVPSQPAHDLAPAMQMAKELAGPDELLELITDGPVVSELPAQTQVRSVGLRAENLALTSARRSDEAGRAMVTVRVSNFGDSTRRVPVRFGGSGVAAQTQEVEVPAGGSIALRAGFTTHSAVWVRLPPDALEADGAISLLPAPRAEVALELLGGLDPAAVSALERFIATTDVPVDAHSTLRFGPPGSAAKVIIGVTEAGAKRSFVGPFFTRYAHPALDDVHLAGAVWTAGPNPEGRVLISAGETVLMSEGDDGAFHLNLDLSRSNVQKTEAWPVLLSNFVRLTRASAPGLPRKQLMLGEEVTVVTGPGASWALRHDDGTVQTILGVGAVTRSPLPKAGHWALLQDGTPVDGLEVLALDPMESDLRTRGPFELAPNRAAPMLASLGVAHERPWWALAALLLLLLADFALTSTERRLP